MKTYFRILSFAKPYNRFLPQYIIVTSLAVVFGVMNFTLLKPLFDVIFDQADATQIARYSEEPQFAMNIDYLIQYFNYQLYAITDKYDKTGALFFVCAIIIVTVFLSNLFRYMSSMIMAKVRARVVKNIRVAVFDHVSKMHLGFFSGKRKGDIMSRITNDVQEVEFSVVGSLKVLFKEPATLISYFVVLFAMSFKLTLFTLVLFPVSGFIISEVVKRLKRNAIETQESLGRIVNILDESLSGIRVIKAFNARRYILQKFDDESKKYAGLVVSMARKNELASPVSELLGVSVVAIILLFGGTMVLNNESNLQASEFITYIIIFSQVLIPAKAISSAFSNLQRGLASGVRIFDILDTQTAIKNNNAPKEKNSFDSIIQINNVSFSYDKKPVLKNINLAVEKGKTVALVGPSGGGKSTLADLIPRFYDPTHGEIAIDGINIKDIELYSLRGLFGIVTQESILFNDTIFNNIAFGIKNAREQDVIKAAQIANAHNFIIQSPNGYQTVIGERGTKLSGGQRQRLTIARAVLKNPPILILDEATSALDSESEKLVQEAITKLMQNRTSIVIAHRLSTIQHADKILVIDQGTIKEEGNHDELIQKKGIYTKLSEMQAM